MFIDLSGYSFSGKSALYDILDSMDDIGGFGFEREFELLRVHGGLYELVLATSGVPWSPLRSDAAIRNFIRLAWNLGGSRSSIKDRIFRLGTYYDDLFPGYSEEVDCLLNGLVGASWEAYWPFKIFLGRPWGNFCEKLGSRLGKNTHHDVYLARVDSDYACMLCHSFFTALEASASKKLNVEHVLLNNTFEPFANDGLYKLSESFIPIVVDRDPRDIYVSAWLKSKGPDNVGSAVIGGSANDFIKRFLIYREATSVHKKVIYIQFEDMVIDCDYLFEKLSSLNLTRKNLYQAWEKVAPLSSSNIGLWRQPLPKEIQDDICLISEKLPLFCRDV